MDANAMDEDVQQINVLTVIASIIQIEPGTDKARQLYRRPIGTNVDAAAIHGLFIGFPVGQKMTAAENSHTLRITGGRYQDYMTALTTQG